MNTLHNFSSQSEFNEALKILRGLEKEGAQEATKHIDALEALKLPVLRLKATVGIVQMLFGAGLIFYDLVFGLVAIASAVWYLADGRKLKLASEFINSTQSKRKRLAA